MARLLNGKKIVDKICTKTLLANKKMLSVNQLNAQIKLTETWKAVHDSEHPLKIEKVKHDTLGCNTREVTKGDLKEVGKSNILQSTYLSDATRIWNKCPENIKMCDSLWKAKKTIRAFVVTLPI